MFVRGGLFQPKLTFVGKARSLPHYGAGERCFTQIYYILTCKHSTRLEKPAKDKHPSLIRTFINYGRKKCYNIGSWSQYHKTLLSNLTC